MRMEADKPISRRKFFSEFFEQAAASSGATSGEKHQSGRRQGWGKYVAAGASLAAAEAVSRMGAGEFPNKVEMKTKSADYRIFYGFHIYQADPREVESTDALLIEYGDSRHEDAENTIRHFAEELITDQFVAIFPEAQRRRVPIFMVDIIRGSRGDAELDRRTLLDVLILGLEIFFGQKLLKRALAPHEQTESRRDFIRRAGQGVLGVYLLTPIAQFGIAGAQALTVNEGPIEDGLLRQTERGLRKFNEAAHPEMGKARHVRNMIMAQKSEFVAQHLKAQLGRRPVLNIHAGPAHIGIEDALRVGEQARMSEIQRGLGESIEGQGIIARIDFVIDDEGNEAIQVTLLQDPAFK